MKQKKTQDDILISTPEELIEAVNTKKITANQFNNVLQQVEIAGNYVEFGKKFLELLQDSLKVHDKYEETLSLLIDRTHKKLMDMEDVELNTERKKEVRELYDEIFRKFENLQDKKREDAKENRNAALTALTMVGAVILLLATGGKFDLSKSLKK